MKTQLTKKLLVALAALMIFPASAWAAERSVMGGREEITDVTAPPPGYYWLEFNGRTSYVDFGSDVSLDNLPQRSFTADLWLLKHDDSWAAGLLSKQKDDYMWDGWELEVWFDQSLWMNVAGTQHDTWGFSATNEKVTPGVWHHIVVYFDRPSGYSYIAIDGQWSTYWAFDPAIGYAVDDDLPLRLGCWLIWNDGNVWDSLDGGISWVRLSEGDRFGVDANFTPPELCVPPEPDDTTIELWTLDEGRGKQTEASVNPVNHGTIVAGKWKRCTP